MTCRFMHFGIYLTLNIFYLWLPYCCLVGNQKRTSWRRANVLPATIFTTHSRLCSHADHVIRFPKLHPSILTFCRGMRDFSHPQFRMYSWYVPFYLQIHPILITVNVSAMFSIIYSRQGRDCVCVFRPSNGPAFVPRVMYGGICGRLLVEW